MLSSTVTGTLVTPPTQTSWVFTPAIDTPATLTPLFVPAYSEFIFLPNLQADTMDVDWIGIKIGDVTGNANPLTLVQGDTDVHLTAEGRSLGKNQLIVEDRVLEVGETVTIPFHLNQAADFFALQWALDLNTEFANIIDAKPLANSGLNAGHIDLDYANIGKVVVIGFNNQSVYLDAGQQLFELTFEVKKSTTLSEILAIDARYLPANLYNEAGDAASIELEFEGELGNMAKDYALMQNQPNPFKDVTQIGFVLPEAAEATITVTDVAGKVIRVIEGDYAAGFNQIELRRAELPANGVLFYQLESGDYQAIKQMTLVE